MTASSECSARHATAAFALGLCALFSTACKTGGSQGSGGTDGEGGGAGGNVAQEGGKGGGGGVGTGGTAGMASGGSGGSGGTGAGGTAQAGMGGAGMTAQGGSGGSGGASVAVDYFVYASGGNQIETFKFNAETGVLTSVEKTNSGPSTTYLAVHPNGKTLYATNESGSGVVKAFSIAKGTGKLTPNGMKDTGGTAAVHVSVHPSGKWLFVSNYSGANVSVFPINQTTGAIEASSDTQPTANESHQIVPDPSGKFVFVPCRADAKPYVFQFKFNDATGKLSANTPAFVASDDPRHIAFHPSGKFAYLINEAPPPEGTPSTLVSFSLSATGTLTQIDKISLPTGENWGSHVVVSPDGKFIYVGGRRTGVILGYSVDATTGKLTEITKTSMSIQVPRDFAMAPTGRHLVIANQSLGNLTVLAIAADGKLSNVGQPTATVADVAGVVVVPVPK